MHAAVSSSAPRRPSVSVSMDHRIRIVYLYAECGYNAEAAARRFNSIYAGIRCVSAGYVRKLVSKFNKRGSVHDGIRSGRPRTSTDQFSAHTVIQEAESTTSLSIERIAVHCHTTKYAVRRIFKENKMRRFPERHLQELRIEDPQKRYRFCTWFLEYRDVFSVLFTDEAIFHLYGKVEKDWFWARTNPRRYRPIHIQRSPKVMVWAGILGTKIIGPYFIYGNINGELKSHLIYT